MQQFLVLLHAWYLILHKISNYGAMQNWGGSLHISMRWCQISGLAAIVFWAFGPFIFSHNLICILIFTLLWWQLSTSSAIKLFKSMVHWHTKSFFCELSGGYLNILLQFPCSSSIFDQWFDYKNFPDYQKMVFYKTNKQTFSISLHKIKIWNVFTETDSG